MIYDVDILSDLRINTGKRTTNRSILPGDLEIDYEGAARQYGISHISFRIITDRFPSMTPSNCQLTKSLVLCSFYLKMHGDSE